jgi:PKD repeat protein
MVNSCIPTASFASSNTNICETACIDFTDQSTNNPTSWNWYFTGGTPDTSTLQNPTGICYNQPGSYDVQLIVSNTGGVDSLTTSGFINVTSCPAPTAGFTTTDTVICVGDCLYFTNLSTGANTWQWTFSGATPSASTDQHPIQICYNVPPGNYPVELVVTNASGADSITRTIVVTEVDAGFHGPNILFLNIGHAFTDTSTGSPVNWDWNFGDGNSSSDQNPTHSYADTGAFTIVLIATNAAGCIDTAEHTVAVVSIINIPSIDNYKPINIYPNPSDGHITLTYPRQTKSGKTNITVYNTLGKVVFSQSNQSISSTVFPLDLSDIPPGIYLLRIYDNNLQTTVKLTIY